MEAEEFLHKNYHDGGVTKAEGWNNSEVVKAMQEYAEHYHAKNSQVVTDEEIKWKVIRLQAKTINKFIRIGTSDKGIKRMINTFNEGVFNYKFSTLPPQEAEKCPACKCESKEAINDCDSIWHYTHYTPQPPKVTWCKRCELEKEEEKSYCECGDQKEPDCMYCITCNEKHSI